jgi:hypothetical protein
LAPIFIGGCLKPTFGVATIHPPFPKVLIAADIKNVKIQRLPPIICKHHKNIGKRQSKFADVNSQWL